jgi:hypothetical protein
MAPARVLTCWPLPLFDRYEDDLDQGEFFLYTGSGGRDLSGNKRTNKACCCAKGICTCSRSTFDYGDS